MPKVVYSMSVSADGYVVGPDGKFDWTAPSEQLHRFHNERVRQLGAHILGRRLYETMVYWETADQDPAASEVTKEFAQIWQQLPKIVFSRSLQSVVGNTRLVGDGDLAAEVASLRESVDGDIEIGGADLGGQAARLGLIDEFLPFVVPVAVGGGTPFFPRDHRIDMELIETQTFGSEAVCLRFRAGAR